LSKIHIFLAPPPLKMFGGGGPLKMFGGGGKKMFAHSVSGLGQITVWNFLPLKYV